MIKILALIGESGSGKTTIAEELRRCGYYVIDSMTTRKPRYEGETGHIFSSYCHYEHDSKNGDIVADTVFDDGYYWTNIKQFKDGWNIYIIDPHGCNQLYLDDRFQTTAIYLRTGLSERFKRMQLTRGYYHAAERMQHDREAFKFIKCDYVIDNSGNVKNAIDQIKKLLND